MQTTNVLVSSLFGNEIQYIIPLFQRHYVWDEENQWQPLWEDIEKKVSRRFFDESTGKGFTQHFTGAIVVQQRVTDVNEVKKYEIIDGQQRLTTFQIILCVLRDICKEKEYDDILGRIERHLLNEDYDSNDEQYKLIPTAYDRNTFISLIVRGTDNSSWFIRSAYRFFHRKIADYVGDDKKKMQMLLRSILEDFALVQILLDSDDEPEKIFESLNMLRKELLQFDLLRNNLFLRARVEEDRDQLYEEYWEHFEKPYWEEKETVARRKITRSELFLQHFIMAKLGVEKADKPFNTYQNEYQKKEIKEKGVRYQLSELKKFSETYEELVNCSPDSEIGKSMLFYRTFDITTLHPFILFVINELEVSGSELSKVLRILECYTVRRLLCIKTSATRNYTKLFSRLIRELKGKIFNLHEFINLLSKETADAYKYPDDMEVEKYLMPSWRASDVTDKVRRYILYRIELRKRKENQLLERGTLDFDSNLTLEHIMPQKWKTTWHLPIIVDESSGCETEKTIMYEGMFTDEYKEEYSISLSTPLTHKDGLIYESYESILNLAQERDIYLHSIGNLTLVTSRHNASLSNDTFSNKREKLFENSTLVLNKEVYKEKTWDIWEIEVRAGEMFTLFCKIWPSLEHFK